MPIVRGISSNLGRLSKLCDCDIAMNRLTTRVTDSVRTPTDPMPEAPAVFELALLFVSERELLDGLKRNDPRAFEVLVRRYGDYLYRVALRVASAEAEARDAVQDAFIGAWRNIHNFENRASLKTWLYRLTVNAALMRMRSTRHRQEVSIDELMPAWNGVRDEPDWDYVESVEISSARAELSTAVRQCIAKLPHTYRIVLVLRDIEGHDTREVAELLGESESNIKVRLHRARAALKILLEPLYRGNAL